MPQPMWIQNNILGYFDNRNSIQWTWFEDPQIRYLVKFEK